MSRTLSPGEEFERDHSIQQARQTLPRTKEDQLQKDVNEIILFLDMLELECVEANKDYAKELHTTSEWDALFFLHQMLLNKHHKLFLALQQQPENMRLQKVLLEDLNMPARLLCSINDFLDLLLNRLPSSPICMNFYDLAYTNITMLLEIATFFEFFWEGRCDHLYGQHD